MWPVEKLSATEVEQGILERIGEAVLLDKCTMKDSSKRKGDYP